VVLRDVGRALRESGSQLTALDVRPFRDIVAPQIEPLRTSAMLFGVTAIMSTFVAMTGIFGLVAQGVRRRTRELAIRVALGASKPSVFMLVARRALMVACAGLLGGVLIASATVWRLKLLLYQVDPMDAGVFVGIAVLTVLVCLVGIGIPARGVTALDPVDALRHS
jgi:ABC-type antimicrobial peptide transport system permease subunit